MTARALHLRYPGAALVTGASSGIGEAFARRLAREHVDLALIARRGDRLSALKIELEAAHGIRVSTIPCDLLDRGAVDEIQARVKAEGVQISLLVHAAGFATFGPAGTLDAGREEEMLDLHCRVPLRLTNVFLPAMLARRCGAVVFVASVAAYQPTPLMATYGASKAFILAYGEALWAELRGRGVDVTVVSPGYTRTALHSTAGISARTLAGWSSGADVADAALDHLGRGPSRIPGIRNWLLSLLPRIATRALAVRGSRLIVSRQIRPLPRD